MATTPTTRAWIGGGNNQASNPNDWIDTNNFNLPGAPQPGDTLVLGTPAHPAASYTMNIQGNDLAGNTLFISSFIASGSLTANLTNHAVAAAIEQYGGG